MQFRNNSSNTNILYVILRIGAGTYPPILWLTLNIFECYVPSVTRRKTSWLLVQPETVHTYMPRLSDVDSSKRSCTSCLVPCWVMDVPSVFAHPTAHGAMDREQSKAKFLSVPISTVATPSTTQSNLSPPMNSTCSMRTVAAENDDKLVISLQQQQHQQQ